MNQVVVGTTLPVLELTLQPGERIHSVSGELSWMRGQMGLRTATSLGGGGLLGFFKRLFGGASVFMTEYAPRGAAPAMVAFATKAPGQILPLTVGPGQSYLTHRHGFLCATPEVEVTVGFQRKLGTGVFGGTGFVLQKLAGSGQAWVALSGEVVTYDLAAGETLRVHPGHVGLFEERVALGITTIPGIKNKLFGGDGLFLATLTGPGKVWLQSLPLSNYAAALEPYLPRQADERDEFGAREGAAGADVAAGAAAGGVLGGLLGGVLGSQGDDSNDSDSDDSGGDDGDSGGADDS